MIRATTENTVTRHTNYKPERGDIIHIDFDPQVGCEIMKKRPALVLSPGIYNAKGPLILCCPITSTIRNGPWEILLPEGLKTKGAILSDQIKSFDWRRRMAIKIESCPKHVVTEVLEKTSLLLS